MPRDVVLIGGGHSHVQVLRRWGMRPPADTRVTLVVDRPVAVYSGMTPALVAGEVARHELEIDVRPLARRAGVRVIVAAARRVDPAARRVVLEGPRPDLPFDLASLDIGSTVAHADLPGVREHALPTRPIATLLDRVDARLAQLRGRDATRVVVVGAGAGGVELAACLEARLRGEGLAPEVTLIASEGGVLPGAADAARHLVRRTLEARGIRIVSGRRVEAVAADHVVLDDGRSLASELTVWVTGAAPHGVGRASGLPVEDRGFVRVRDDLRVVDHDHLFAVGDCAVLDSAPWVPRAGVYAVRQGPVLARNLEAVLACRPTRPYRPQRDFLSMLNLGDGTAVVSKWGIALRGAWVWRWKDRIDRRFMARFQALDADGGPDTPLADDMPVMDDPHMACGGCAAKLDRVALDALLDATCGVEPPDVVDGVGSRDDAARVRVGDARIALSVDGFPDPGDDPWLHGRLLASHAAADLLAKGVAPTHAVVHVLAPAHGGRDVRALMLGLHEGARREGFAIVGGHTGLGDERVAALTVVGEASTWWPLHGGAPGQPLVLTGPIGTGVLLRADRLGLAAGPWLAAWEEAVLRGARSAHAVLLRQPPSACTDVTGFGLAGHAAALADASGCTARIDPARVPRFEGVDGLLDRGLRSSAHEANARQGGVRVDPALSRPRADVVFDPQTAGPFLAAVPRLEADRLVAALREAGHDAAVVGRLLPREDGVSVRVEEDEA